MVETEEEVVELGKCKCIASVHITGDVILRCVQDMNTANLDLKIDEHELAMIKGISEIAIKSKNKKDKK